MSNENKQSISVSYQRTNPVALDATCVFDTLAEACIYVCKENTTAYPGQIISVKDDIENTYVVTQAPDGELNLDLYDFDVYYVMSLLYPDNLYVPPVGTTEVNRTLSGGYVQIPSTVKKLTNIVNANGFVSKYVVPTSVRTIGENAFANSTLKKIIIPPRVTDIGASCFSDLVYLKEVNILADIPVIKSGTFQMCTGLETIKLPESITRIGDGAFYGCSILEDFTIPESVTRIGKDAFTGCSSDLVTIDDSNISYVGNWVVGGTVPGQGYRPGGDSFAFTIGIKNNTIGISDYGCVGADGKYVMIRTFELASSLKYIGKHAFDNMTAIEGIKFSNPNGWQVFDDNGNLIRSVDASDLTDTASALKFLTVDYSDYYWRRIDQ